MLTKAKELLKDNATRLVIIDNQNTITRTERGVKAILDILESNAITKGAFVADKVVGKAAAMIYILLGIKALYASVISEGAKAIIEANGIALECDTVVPYIVNRTGDGMCPMEQAVGDESDPILAVEKVKKKLAVLNQISK